MGATYLNGPSARGVYTPVSHEPSMRRSTMILSGALIAGCAHPSSAPRSASSGALAYAPSAASERELLPDEQVRQGLSRMAFGARPEDAAKVRAVGVDNWIPIQLHPETIPDDTPPGLIAPYASLNPPTTVMT